MQETTTFIKFEKRTKDMNIASIVLGAVFLALVIVFTVLGLVGDEITFGLYFYIVLASAVLYIAVPLPLSILSQKRSKLIALYRSYSRVLNRHPHNAVNVIYEAGGRPKEQIFAEFVKLHSMGFLDGVFIDEQNGIVNIREDGDKCENEFICPVCGGKSQVSENHEVYECEYCGAIKEKEE